MGGFSPRLCRPKTFHHDTVNAALEFFKNRICSLRRTGWGWTFLEFLTEKFSFKPYRDTDTKKFV
jgi:hypothetical protein